MRLLPQSLGMYKMNSVFFRIFLAITGLVFLSVLIVGYASYRSSTGLLLEEVENSNLLMLRQARDSVDMDIDVLRNYAMQAALDSRINKALFVPANDAGAEIELYRDIITYLNSIKSSNDVYTNIWIYFNKSGTVVGNEGKYNSELFFSKICRYRADMTWEKVFGEYSAFRSLGRQEIEYGNSELQVITFTRSVPINEINPMATIVFNIGEKLFNRALRGDGDKNIVINYIVDTSGNVVFSNESKYESSIDKTAARTVIGNSLKEMKFIEGTLDRDIQGKPFTIQYAASRENYWRYISLTPTYLITAKAKNIRNVTVIIILISTLLGLVLTYVLAKRLYNPINDIMNYISVISDKRLDKERAGSKDELKFINRIIGYVYNENESLRDSFNKSLPMLKEKFLNDIADGKVSDLKLREIGTNLGIEMPFRFFQVLVFEIDDYTVVGFKDEKKLDMSLVSVVEDIGGEVLGQHARGYHIRKRGSTIVSIINSEESFQESGSIHEFISLVSEYFRKNYGITFTIGVGKAYEKPEDCSMSFIEALYALKYKMVKGQNTVIHIDEVSNIPKSILDYPMEKEKQLVTIIKSGDIKSAKELLEEIFERNLGRRSMSTEMITNLFNALAGTAIRTIYEMQSTVEEILGGESDVYNALGAKNTVAEKKSYLISLFETVAGYSSKRKLSQSRTVYDKVKAYIEKNYRNELSLDRAATVVELSPSYLSFVFREVSGKNFVDFVNEYRIERAKELLKSSSMNMSEIAERVGYANSNTFIKVFKKYEGVTPGMFRGIDKQF